MSARATLRPYKGLAPFDDEALDALLFFGREREREMIVANLLASRLTVLYGPSGVGKSSLLRAGVAQRLRTFADSVRRDHRLVGQRTRRRRSTRPIAASEGDTHLILDQIEEYFLYHDPDECVRAAPAGARDRAGPARERPARNPRGLAGEARPLQEPDPEPVRELPPARSPGPCGGPRGDRRSARAATTSSRRRRSRTRRARARRGGARPGCNGEDRVRARAGGASYPDKTNPVG